jgi:tellurite resistance protein
MAGMIHRSDTPSSGMPPSLFAAPLGVTGLGVAWRKAAAFSAPSWIGETLIFLGALIFAWVMCAYGLKFMRSPGAVRSEFRDLRKLSLFAALPLSLSLLSGGALPAAPDIARLLWLAATALQLILLLIILWRWAQGGHARNLLQPGIFLPLAGILLAPVTGVPLGFQEISWMLFSAGLVLWLAFLPLLFQRLFFDMPVQEGDLPSLAIFITPPALAFMAYLPLSGAAGGFAHILFYTAIFFLIFLLLHAGRLARLAFSPSWWALTFPAAALASASLSYHMAQETDFPLLLCAGLLGMASLVILYCGARTLYALARGKLY